MANNSKDRRCEQTIANFPREIEACEVTRASVFLIPVTGPDARHCLMWAQEAPEFSIGEV